MSKALVTGGCGFLGSAIVRALDARGVESRVLALPNEPADNLGSIDAELVRGDVLDRDAVTRAVEGVDTVYHAAAIYKAWMPDPTLMYDVNLSGTFNVLEAARRAGKRVIYTASIASLGRPAPGALGDEATAYEAWDLDFAYSRAKYHSRKLAQDFAGWGLDVRIVCPGIVFGPGDISPTPSGKLIINSLKGGPPVYMDGGASYVDVRDAALAHVLADEKGRAGEMYIATAHNLSNLELLQAIDRAAGRSRRYLRLPVAVARSAIVAMDRSARRTGKEPLLSLSFFEYSLKASYYTNAKAIHELGATFRPVGETIRDAIDYFRGRGLV
ncbi:MAG: NAD-dependent epimerase/dehydratase family protein [Sorangiineae bacterium]|nr:NAD-dependent epimerase/dehydratase family protein [Polyangiaceae bacterium]MEB2320872.1 NAD-dependent epimerase/dehydratase family protein [Sorangiineae bacterium]